MTPKENALRIVKNNEEKIRDTLFQNGYMFDDDFDELMNSLIARKLADCINEYFGLEEQIVIRREISPTTRTNGILFFIDSNLEWDEIEEIAKEHYQLN